MFLRITGAIASLAVTFQPVSALAWGPQGHETVATVARDILMKDDPKAANEMFAIIKADNLYEKFKQRNRKTKQWEEKTCQVKTIAQLANWPDCVRPSPKYSDTSPSHFDNAARCGSGSALPPKKEYCADGSCGSASLKEWIKTLKDKSASPRARAEALSFIIHIVGDLHQPMHATDNGGDRGGNEVAILFKPDAFPSFNPRSDKLHGLWDGDLVKGALGTPKDGISLIGKLASASDPEFADLDPDRWVLASHMLAEKAYTGLENAPACRAGEWKDSVVTRGYVTDNQKVVTRQLTLASARLAAILEDAL